MTVLFLAAIAVTLSLRLWLAERQTRCVMRHRDAVPAAFADRIALKDHQKAANYTAALLRHGRLSLIARMALLLAWTLGGGLDLLDYVFARDSLLAGAGLVLSVHAISELALLPFAIRRVFGIEERFGFNRTTPARFLGDLFKSALIGLLLGGPFFWGALWLMRHGGGLWWALAWAGWLAFSLLLLWIYPTWIAPLFNRFTRLEDPDLTGRIRELLERNGFASSGLFVMDGTRRSTHANAYFTGLGRRKRIVLFDSLLQMLDPPETVAVLAHELGHFKRRHIWMRMLQGAASGLLALGLLALLREQEWFYRGLGVSTPSDRTGLLLFFFAAPLFVFVLRPLFSAWSRRHEYQADAFAAENADAAHLIGALVKLYEGNATTLTPDPVYSAFHDSHPPAALRIAHLQGWG
ncbi:MAG: M48 family metallopeptidase [Planctomycetota bacterium]